MDDPVPNNGTDTAGAAVGDSDYRLMIEAVSDYSILLLDPEGRVRSWNAGAQRLKGYVREEVLGRHFSLFYPQESIDRGWPEEALRRAREKGRFEDEGWRLRKDGSRFWASVVITHLVDSEGRSRGFSNITRDQSERRQREELLRQSDERFRLIVEGIKDYAIFMLDPAGYIASWNAGAEKTKGYAEHEIIGKHFSVFYPPEVIKRGWPEEELRRAIENGRFEDEGWRLRKDGSKFWASVVIAALFDEAGRHRGFAKVTRDLTERRRIGVLEDESRRIATFLAMLGHELRNPLAPISNAAAIMDMETIESETLRAARDVISRQLRHMTRLVDDLLDVGRITSGKIRLDLKPLKLSTAIEEAVEAVQPMARAKQQSLNVEFVGAPPWVRADRARIVQVVVNLLSNASKYTQLGGHISVRLEARGQNAEVSVKDDGPGIAPELLPNLYTLFVQGQQDSARTQGGLGLGLSLVQQLVALHGGDVAAYSAGRPGEGSEFVVRLPRILEGKGTSEDNVRLHAASQPRTILVVDDNTDSANTVAMLLEMLGYRAPVAYNGPAALAAVREKMPDALLLDIGLPGMSGLEVARSLHAEHAAPPRLIALTGYGQDQDREASRQAGFDAHLIKPLQPRQLAEVIERLFG